jgi:hypothetical protein
VETLRVSKSAMLLLGPSSSVVSCQRHHGSHGLFSGGKLDFVQ